MSWNACDDEFDLADAARPELDVLRESSRADFLRDQRLHLAQRFEHAVVEIAAIHERREQSGRYTSRSELAAGDGRAFMHA